MGCAGRPTVVKRPDLGVGLVAHRSRERTAWLLGVEILLDQEWWILGGLVSVLADGDRGYTKALWWWLPRSRSGSSGPLPGCCRNLGGYGCAWQREFQSCSAARSWWGKGLTHLPLVNVRKSSARQLPARSISPRPGVLGTTSHRLCTHYHLDLMEEEGGATLNKTTKFSWCGREECDMLTFQILFGKRQLSSKT
ncbi:hypothetical protein AKJ16_DCAP01670 [Drosera capensis]